MYNTQQNTQQQPSSRNAYPNFLSISQTCQLQFSYARQGILDGCRFDTLMTTLAGDGEIRACFYKSLLLNTLSVVSIYTFDFFFHPLVKDQQKWLYRNIGWFYQILWLLPLLGISFYCNVANYCLGYFGLVVGVVFDHRKAGVYDAVWESTMSAYRGVMVVTSFVISSLLRTIPYVGPLAGLIFFCWIDSFYCFEFVWIPKGVSLSKRIRHLEERWAYYFGFGFPSAVLCMFGSGLANLALFFLIYPAFIILAIRARPIPQDPYAPIQPTDDHDVVRLPSPFLPIRLPIFALVLKLNDVVVKTLSIGGSGRSQTRPRVFSDPIEVEGGKRFEPTEPRVRVTRGGMSLGRKKD